MKGRAVVIGGGMAGLVTAEMLSKHFSEVVMLERDQPQGLWEENAVAMAGVRVSVRITQSLALRLAQSRIENCKYRPATPPA